ncbi:cytoglobin-2 [Fopius arisanus]|uniref:Cygb2_0 protein n=1 Tax=Fopius arisanus TaxID=64838 RepID=A0A0C9QI71_9HYME|nr:PREDICTED: cytoglobin-2 [Fopius arisanus]XP_011310263.1 PREDICTED: cytoglobin-2 [Fopius arisanus]
MGTFWSKFWGQSGAPDIVDPSTGMTAREKRLVQNTWVIVSKDPVASGVAIMTLFFERYPEYQALFSAFRDVPREELPANKKFQAHCASIITALNSVIDALNDDGLLEATLVAIGERHRRRGQTTEHFLNLKQVIMDILRQALSSKFTEETEEAWKKTIEAAYTHIFNGLRVST